MAKRYWLMKVEPEAYSIEQFERDKTTGWEGVRNYQARNFLRDGLQTGDGVLIYHSQCKAVGIVGSARVIRAAYPDPAQYQPDSHYYDPKATEAAPRWFCVDIAFEQQFARPLLLPDIKADPALADMVLVKQVRLSVQPVRAPEWAHILKRGV